ncbi:MAG: bifunctional acetylxylan esterase/glucomannan deacetylase AxeC2 [Duganella sp.]
MATRRFGVAACLLAAAGLLLSVAANAAPDETSIAANDARIVRMGRSVSGADGAVRFGYPGVSFHVSFEGSRLAVEAQASGANSYFDVMVDGGPARKLRLAPGVQTLALAQDLKPGRHTVEIVNRSETWHGTARLRRFYTDGAWLAAPPLPMRKMLVLGDSVTCGEAIDRVPGAVKDPSWWNARASYGMQLARALQAQVQLVCAGGRGLVRSWDNRSDTLNLPDFYQLAIADQAAPVAWRQRDYQSDLVLVAIGTNDFSPGIPPREQYVGAYVRLVRTLLADHPQAQIVLTEGALLTGEKKAALVEYLGETRRRVADARVHLVASQAYPGDAQDGHPTRAQTDAIANDLLAPVRAIMHW